MKGIIHHVKEYLLAVSKSILRSDSQQVTQGHLTGLFPKACPETQAGREPGLIQELAPGRRGKETKAGQRSLCTAGPQSLTEMLPKGFRTGDLSLYILKILHSQLYRSPVPSIPHTTCHGRRTVNITLRHIWKQAQGAPNSRNNHMQPNSGRCYHGLSKTRH